MWEAVASIDAIIHAASDSRNAEAVDVEGTRRLVDAARARGVRHVVFISIVGIDQIPFAYYQKKLAAESIVMSGGVPYSVLRATQFHSLVDGLISTAAEIAEPPIRSVRRRRLVQRRVEHDLERAE